MSEQPRVSDAKKLDQTLNDIFNNFVFGGLKGLEGIWDAGATVVGAVGGLFDKEFQGNIQDHIKV